MIIMWHDREANYLYNGNHMRIYQISYQHAVYLKFVQHYLSNIFQWKYAFKLKKGNIHVSVYIRICRYRYVIIYVSIQMYTQFTLEQHRFEWHGPLTCRGFSIIRTTELHDCWLVEYAASDRRYSWLTLKLYVNFQLCGGLAFLTNTLFKGQQYTCCKYLNEEWDVRLCTHILQG